MLAFFVESGYNIGNIKFPVYRSDDYETYNHIWYL